MIDVILLACIGALLTWITILKRRLGEIESRLDRLEGKGRH